MNENCAIAALGLQHLLPISISPALATQTKGPALRWP